MDFIIKFIYRLFILFRELVAIFLFRLNIIPDKYKDRVRVLIKSRQYRKKFLKLNLSYDELGFYFLDPMPSKDFLKNYYEETYWQNRNDKNYPIRSRDIEHYKLLKRIYPDFDKYKKKF